MALRDGRQKIEQGWDGWESGGWVLWEVCMCVGEDMVEGTVEQRKESLA